MVVLAFRSQIELDNISTSIPFSLVCEPEFHLVEARMRDLSHCLGVSTLPWGRMTDTHEKELPLLAYDPKVEGRLYALSVNGRWTRDRRIWGALDPVHNVSYGFGLEPR
ncbi:hypothetical protein CRG98_033140 [Punica granatum]|uniref:Uncharacterized protein n=1 Tax=Punica granatum TaxID=22663 RepID=A0A2I0IR21_PUNGR|nr:hypothetical protein CRG98_033140 [Punica granatum]